jgi:predicted nucleic acid-binding protein
MSEFTAFDADVLIYAVDEDNPASPRILDLFADDGPAGMGSVILLTEALSKPFREDADSPVAVRLIDLLGRLELLPVDLATGRLALALAVRYRLRTADATHLATAVAAGADRFLTNNRKDFPKSISEIEIVYPEDL